jgi:hypothetical protein
MLAVKLLNNKAGFGQARPVPSQNLARAMARQRASPGNSDIGKKFEDLKPSAGSQARAATHTKVSAESAAAVLGFACHSRLRPSYNAPPILEPHARY